LSWGCDKRGFNFVEKANPAAAANNQPTIIIGRHFLLRQSRIILTSLVWHGGKQNNCIPYASHLTTIVVYFNHFQFPSSRVASLKDLIQSVRAAACYVSLVPWFFKDVSLSLNIKSTLKRLSGSIDSMSNIESNLGLAQ